MALKINKQTWIQLKTNTGEQGSSNLNTNNNQSSNPLASKGSNFNPIINSAF